MLTSSSSCRQWYASLWQRTNQRHYHRYTLMACFNVRQWLRHL